MSEFETIKSKISSQKEYLQKTYGVSEIGVFGSFAAVVIWVYYAAQILFFGAEFTRVHAQLRGHPLEPDNHAEVVT